MPQRRENFLLSQSPQFDIATGAENRTDLTLTPNPEAAFAPVAGNVSDGTSPLPNALVKVLTTTGNPVDHQYTNSDGNYASKELPTGIYHVVASAPGFLTSPTTVANVSGTEGTFANFVLTPDPRAVKNTLYGLVLDQTTGSRLDNATVTLTDSIGETVAATLSDSVGEYLLYEIDNGSYLIGASRAGYQLPVPLTIDLTGSQIAQTNISLAPTVAAEGTVQGFITDQNNIRLAMACVGLYSVTGSTETLVQTTLSNLNGFYLFGGVTAGTYLVKAKDDILI